jgi:hypothetical protein
MYAQIFLVTSVRGSALLPTTSASVLLGVIAFMNAAFGFRFVALRADFFAAFFALFFAAFFAPFFAAFFLAAIEILL